MIHLLRKVVILTAALLWTRGSIAQPTLNAKPCQAPPSVKAVAQAKVAFHKGEKAFQEAAYERAIDFWSTAYKRDCTAHALLLNLATAQELYYQPQQAIHALRLFNRRKPLSPYTEANFKRIIRLEDLIIKQQLAQEEIEKLRLRRTQQSQQANPAPIAPQPNRGFLPTALVGGGVFTSLAGLAIYLEATSAEKKAQEACDGNRTRCENFGAVLSGESARSRVQLGGLLTATGLALTSGGLLWRWLEAPTPTTTEDTQAKAGKNLNWAASGSDEGLSLHVTGKF